jgi:general secretion pathway protein G
VSRTLAAVVALALAAGGTWFVSRITGNTDENWAQDHARAEVSVLGAKVEQFIADTGRPPQALEELTRKDTDPRSQGPYAMNRELIDPWERPYYYRALSRKDFTLFTLGADGRIGGRGDDTDRTYAPTTDHTSDR